MLHAVQKVAGRAPIMMFAHNPDLTTLLERFQGGAEALGGGDLPTCGAALVEFEGVQSWADVKWRHGHVRWVIRPSQLQHNKEHIH